MSDIIRLEEQCAIYARAIMDCSKERDALRAERDALKAELDEASPMTRCECCGSSFRLHKMVIEEGDRWECYPCWEALNEKERSK